LPGAEPGREGVPVATSLCHSHESSLGRRFVRSNSKARPKDPGGSGVDGPWKPGLPQLGLRLEPVIAVLILRTGFFLPDGIGATGNFLVSGFGR